MHKIFTLEGQICAYFEGSTRFLVQVGKGKKGSYKTRYDVGDPTQAVALFNAINIGNGYKKRLFVPTFNKPVLARQTSL